MVVLKELETRTKSQVRETGEVRVGVELEEEMVLGQDAGARVVVLVLTTLPQEIKVPALAVKMQMRSRSRIKHQPGGVVDSSRKNEWAARAGCVKVDC